MTDPCTEETTPVATSPVKGTAVATTQSPKSSPTKKDIDIAAEALNQLAQGKRHLLVNDITLAVNSLQEACRLLAEHYGETAPECADAYFYYGKSLLELARIENGVLGNALDGVPEEDAEADSSQIGDPEKLSDDKDEEEAEGEEEEEEGEDIEEAAENGEEKSQGDTEDADDVGNLQLAWEMLELAKLIYTKQLEEKPKMNLKIAQVHLKLGEVGLEGENYQQSVEDLKKCFEIQDKELASDDRCLAETHYQLGVAYSFSEDFDNAIESFSNAAKVVEERKEKLLKLKTEKESWTKEQKLKDSEGKDPFYTEEAEIEELSNLLPEIKDKITDMEDMKKDSTEKLKKIKEATFATLLGGSRSGEASTSGQSSTGFDAPSSSGFDAPSSSSGFDAPSSSSAFDTASTKTEKATSNITHLVRKKRKPDEEAEPAEVAKKAKGENGEAVAAAVDEENKPENGVEKKEKDKAPMETEETNEASKITEIKKAVAETAAEEKKPEEVSSA